jgi:hypothetical protein
MDPYFSVEALSASGAKLLLKSPAHFRENQVNPPEPTPSMALGTATHAAILEPHRNDPFVIRPADLDRRTKDGKARWDALVAEAGAMPIITQDEADAIRRMRDAVHAVPMLADAIAKGQTEVPLFWSGRGVPCKAKADLVVGDTIIDLKTCTDASRAGFFGNVKKYQYHLQARHYLDGFGAQGVNTFLFVALETTRPHGLAIYELTQPMMDDADTLLDVAAERYALGIGTGEWPGYDATIQHLGPSPMLGLA